MPKKSLYEQIMTSSNKNTKTINYDNVKRFVENAIREADKCKQFHVSFDILEIELLKWNTPFKINAIPRKFVDDIINEFKPQGFKVDIFDNDILIIRW